MIGATTGAIPASVPGAVPPQSGASDADAATGCRTDAGKRAHGGAPDGRAAHESAATRSHAGARRAVERNGRQDDTRQEQADGNTAAREFAELLQGDVAGTAAKPGKPATDSETRTDEPQAGLPERLLALLAGHPAAPAADQPSGSNAAGPTPSAGNGAKASPPPLPFIAGPASNATADPGAPAEAGPGDAPFSALMKLAGDATATGIDRGGNAAGSVDTLPVPSTLPTTGPAPAHPRAVAVLPGAPLALPANPDAGFDDGFGTRIAWMAEQRLGHAEIRLNPEHIGPIDVRVQLDGDRVNAEFHSAHAEVRQALEASVPRLRELLGQQGLQLGHADVGQRQAWQNPSTGDGASVQQGEAGGKDLPQAASTTELRIRSRRLLDEYA